MNRLNKFTLFFILFLLLASTAILPTAYSATPTLYAANELQLPERPTPPKPPSSPKNNEKKEAAEQQPAAKPPASPQQAPAAKPAKEEIAKPKPSAADNKPDTAVNQPANTPPTANGSIYLPDDSEDKPAEPAAKSAQLKPGANNFFSNFIKNTIYSTLILAIIVFSGYLYFTTPKDTPKQKPVLTPKKSTAPATKKTPATLVTANAPKSPANNQSDPLLSNMKITNRSLLEQLIKYDLETYGEIRTNLDYEQPAYVEKLIRKHGGTDKNKVNRAIQLFYQNRTQR